MANNGEKKLGRILEGIQYLIGDNKHLREDLKEYSRQAAEDRKQAAEDRKQAAEDRHEMKDLIRGIRQALVVIGKRGGEFVEIQKQPGEQLRKLTEIAEKNTAILEAIHKGLNGKKHANGR